MSARTSLKAALIAALLTGSATAQIVSSGSLGKVDPWAVGWLGQSEGALDAEIWRNTDASALQPLLSSIDPAGLSPAARHGLRRLIMSAAHAPTDGEALLPERLRLLEALGESRRADELRDQYAGAKWTTTNATSASSIALIDGRAVSECAELTKQRADTPSLIPLRSLCYAIAQDFDAASLAAEQTEGDDTIDTPWLISAIEVMRDPPPKRPMGRFDTPFEIAVSTLAGLEPDPKIDLTDLTADIASAILLQPTAAASLRPTLVLSLVEQNRLMATDGLDLLNASFDAEAKNAKSKPGPLVKAVNAHFDATAKPADKAAALVELLQSASNAREHRRFARLIAPVIAGLPAEPSNQKYADVFVRAAIAANDPALAQEWRNLLSAETKGIDDWSLARLDLAIAVAAADASLATKAANRLIAVSPLAPDAEVPTARAARQTFDTRATETSRLLFLMVGAGKPLSPAARDILPSLRTSGRGISDPAIMRIMAANDAQASGEAALAALSLVYVDPSEQSYIGLADVLAQLRRAGLADDAKNIALEAIPVWKTF